MGEAICASFLHVVSSEKNNFHSLCEKGSTSWCHYQRDQANKTNLYKAGDGLSKEMIALVKPIYQALMKSEELDKCLHGRTQNHNESLNGMIWQCSQTNTYVSLQKLQFSIYDAVACFNEGRIGSINILKHVGIEPGFYMFELWTLGGEWSQHIGGTIKQRSAGKFFAPWKSVKQIKIRRKKEIHIRREGFNYYTFTRKISDLIQ